MPKQVDHEERRQAIASALWRIVGANGMEAVSLRHVAAEAGVSMGMVQHYFSSKDEMLLFALESLSARVAARLANGVPAGSPIRTMLLQMLPLDDERRAEAHVVVAFIARAAVEPAIAEAMRRVAGPFQEYIAAEISRAGVPGAWEHAAALLAVLDGLTVHIMVGLQTPEAAVAALDAHLGRLLGEEPAPPGSSA
jgi:AcrR family transcriptional regulator